MGYTYRQQGDAISLLGEKLEVTSPKKWNTHV
jgi:hypothetical protein